MSLFFSFLTHLTVLPFGLKRLLKKYLKCCGMWSLPTSVYHPHFTVFRVMDNLLHTTQGSASGSLPFCAHGDFPRIADTKLGELKMRRESWIGTQ